MRTPLLLLFICFICFSSAWIIPLNTSNVEWLKLEDITQKLKEQNKPVIIDLYTDWCHWCKVMDEKTYSHKKVIDYISEHFYASRVNAETMETINWRGKNYNYNSQYKINDFSLFITYGQASFPTTVIIPDDGSAAIPIAGYMKPKEIEPILKFFGEGAYKTQTYPEFQKTFHASW